MEWELNYSGLVQDQQHPVSRHKDKADTLSPQAYCCLPLEPVSEISMTSKPRQVSNMKAMVAAQQGAGGGRREPTQSKPRQQVSTNKPRTGSVSQIQNQSIKYKSPTASPPHLQALGSGPSQPHGHTPQLLTSIHHSHVGHVAQIISWTPVSRPVPVIAEVMPALTENMQPVRGHRVPHQRHNLALPAGAEGQTLLEIPVIVSNSPELNCGGNEVRRLSDFTPLARKGWGHFSFSKDLFCSASSWR